MKRCPQCRGELEQDHVGGTRQTPTRGVLLCPRCWLVFPFDPRPRLHLVETRRDLA